MKAIILAGLMAGLSMAHAYTGLPKEDAERIQRDCLSVGLEYAVHWSTTTHLDSAWCEPKEPWAKPIHNITTPLDHDKLIGLTYNCLYRSYSAGKLGMTEWVTGDFDVLDYVKFSVPLFDTIPSKVDCKD